MNLAADGNLLDNDYTTAVGDNVNSGKDPAEVIAIFRIPGSWEEEGFKILAKYGVEYCDRSVSLYEAAGRAVGKLS